MVRAGVNILAFIGLLAGCRGDAAKPRPGTAIPAFSSVFRPVDSVELMPLASSPIGRLRCLQPLGRQLVVGDRTSADLKVFDASGKFVHAIGRTGSGPGEFREPAAAAVLTDGSLAVADVGNARITIYDSSLQWKGQFDFPGVIMNVAAAPEARVAVLALRVSEQEIRSYDAVHLYEQSGELVRAGCAAPLPTRPMERNVTGFSGALLGHTIMWTTMVENVARSCDPSTGLEDKFRIGHAIYVPPRFPERPLSPQGGGQRWMSSQMWVSRIVGLDSGRYIVRFSVLGESDTPELRYVVADRAGRTIAVTGPTDLWVEFARDDTVYATRRTDAGRVWLVRLASPR